MMSVFEAACVIARRDFVASVYSRSFILFLIVPLVFLAIIIASGAIADRAANAAAQVRVAVVADSATVEALQAARARLVGSTSDRIFPSLQAIAPAENVDAQADALLADEQAAYSAIFSGTLDRPVISGPPNVQQRVVGPLMLIVDDARLQTVLREAHLSQTSASAQRRITGQSAGNLKIVRNDMARSTQSLIFGITVILTTLLLSNMNEEKSNKVIEIMAAAISLDSVFLGKLAAMLGISLVGLAVWGGMIGLGYLFVQVVQDWVTFPDAGPAIGWPSFILLIVLYYTTNYMLFGALFLGIGSQASSMREIQTLTMPLNFMQFGVLLLATTAVGRDGGMLIWIARLFPLSSPLTMIGSAAQSDAIWPHLVALTWQLAWVALIIRISSRMFRVTVMKSSNSGSFFALDRLWHKRNID
jgi:ABC-2 type transport system permease protein